MIPVYYPYWESGSEWDELRYSLRSLEKHLKAEYQVYIVGDLPAWAQNVIHIPYKHEYGGDNWPVVNAMQMLKVFIETLNPGDEFFLRMYDDIYFLKDRTINDLMVTRVIKTREEARNLLSGSYKWRELVLNTIKALTARGYDGYMTESHCPELFSAQKMEFIFTVFELPEQQLLTSTLYYNLFPFEKFITDRKIERALFYGDENDYAYSSHDIALKCKDKCYLNHNDTGLNYELKNYIKGRFRGKSKHEL